MVGRTSAIGLLCALVAGCDSGPTGPTCYPVTGKVLVDGKPAVRAMVQFVPAGPAPDGKTYTPSTFTDDDGAFQLTTFAAGDGAPAGEYTVTVVVNFVVKGGQDVPVPDLLNGRYADPKKSPLKATVRPEPNTLEPFDLKSR